MKNTVSQGLTPNQIKRLELIRSSIINIHDSPEFNQMDYQPDVTLGDAVQAIEELIEQCDPTPTIKLTIRHRFSLTEFLGKTMLTSFFACGLFACAALFSTGLNEINQTQFSVADNVDWKSLGKATTGLSMVALAVSATCALTAVAANVKE